MIQSLIFKRGGRILNNFCFYFLYSLYYSAAPAMSTHDNTDYKEAALFAADAADTVVSAFCILYDNFFGLSVKI